MTYLSTYEYNLKLFLSRFLLKNGADKDVVSCDGERPLDLVDPQDFAVVRVMLDPDALKDRSSSTEELDDRTDDSEDEDEEEEEEDLSGNT